MSGRPLPGSTSPGRLADARPWPQRCAACDPIAPGRRPVARIPDVQRRSRPTRPRWAITRTPSISPVLAPPKRNPALNFPFGQYSSQGAARMGIDLAPAPPADQARQRQFCVRSASDLTALVRTPHPTNAIRRVGGTFATAKAPAPASDPASRTCPTRHAGRCAEQSRGTVDAGGSGGSARCPPTSTSCSTCWPA